jgi:preprotein translocase subunit YajC
VGGAADLLPLVLLGVAFWFLLIRPQRRRQQQVLATQRGVAVGDEVMTNAGFFGRVTAELDDPAAGDCLMLEVAPGTEIKVARGAVMRVVTAPDTEPEADTEADTEPHTQPEVGPTGPTGPIDPPTDDHRSI